MQFLLYYIEELLVLFAALSNDCTANLQPLYPSSYRWQTHLFERLSLDRLQNLCQNKVRSIPRNSGLLVFNLCTFCTHTSVLLSNYGFPLNNQQHRLSKVSCVLMRGRVDSCGYGSAFAMVFTLYINYQPLYTLSYIYKSIAYSQ